MMLRGDVSFIRNGRLTLETIHLANVSNIGRAELLLAHCIQIPAAVLLLSKGKANELILTLLYHVHAPLPPIFGLL